MPTFRYKAADAGGRVTRGELAAESAFAAGEDLDQRGFVPLQLDQVTRVSDRWKVWRGGAKWKIEDKVLFTQKFASLIKAGIPLLAALELIARQTKNKDVAATLRRVADAVANGQTLHDGMSAFPRLFDSVYLGAIHTGESTGHLDSTLDHTADFLEREMNTRRQVKQAFRYPIMVVVAIGFAGLLILKYVIPQFMAIYGHFGSALPLPTRALMAAADIIDQIWWYLPVGFAAIWFGWKSWMKTSGGRKRRDHWLLRLPIVGTLFLKVSVSRFARLFGVLFSAGLPATAALDIVATAVGNVIVGEEVVGLRNRISSGGNAGDMPSGAVMPELVYEMIAIGFESGQVERMLGEVARHFDQEVEFDVRRLSDRLQPVILVILAAAVLVVALAVLSPIWNLITLVK